MGLREPYRAQWGKPYGVEYYVVGVAYTTIRDTARVVTTYVGYGGDIVHARHCRAMRPTIVHARV